MTSIIIGWCLVGAYSVMCAAPIPGAAPFGSPPHTHTPGQGHTRNLRTSTPLSMVSMVTRVLFVAVVLRGSPRIFAHLNHVKDFIAAADFLLNTYIAMAMKRASFRLLLSATRIRSTVMKNADLFSKMKGTARCGFSSSNKTWSSSSNSLSSVNAASPRKMRKPVRDYTVQTIINEELWLGVFRIYSPNSMVNSIDPMNPIYQPDSINTVTYL